MATVPPPQSGSGIFGLVPGALDPISAILAQATSIGSPQTVGLPNPFGDLSAIYPGLGKTNNALSALIASQLSGELSPQEQNAIQDARARFGVSSGMPGSGLNRSATVRDLGLATGQRQQQGVANYGSIIPTISRTQTVDPSLQAQIGQFNANAANNIAQMNAQFQNQFALANAGAQNRANEFNSNIADRNATYAAAPNPEQAQSYAQKLFDQYLQKTQGGGQQFGGGSSVNRGVGGPAGGTSFGSSLNGIGGTFDSDGRFSQTPVAASGTRQSSPYSPPNLGGGGGGNLQGILNNLAGTGTSAMGNLNNFGPPVIANGTGEIQSRVWDDPWKNFSGFNFATGSAPTNDTLSTVPVGGGGFDDGLWWLENQV